MWKDSIRNIVVIFQPNILRIVGFYVRHSTIQLSALKQQQKAITFCIEISTGKRKGRILDKLPEHSDDKLCN